MQGPEPWLRDGAIFVPTRVQERLQEQSADGTYRDIDASRRTYYVGAIDDFLLRITANVEFGRFHRADPSHPFQYALMHSGPTHMQ